MDSGTIRLNAQLSVNELLKRTDDDMCSLALIDKKLVGNKLHYRFLKKILRFALRKIILINLGNDAILTCLK